VNILIVDDEESILNSIGNFLKDFNHEIKTFSSSVAALGYLNEAPAVDLIISDIRMPKINGIEFLEIVQIRNPGLPMLMMTGYGDEDIAVRAFQGGAFDYLKKPVSLRELLKVIKRIEARLKLESEFGPQPKQPHGGNRLFSPAEEANKHV